MQWRREGGGPICARKVPVRPTDCQVFPGLLSKAGDILRGHPRCGGEPEQLDRYIKGAPSTVC